MDDPENQEVSVHFNLKLPNGKNDIPINCDEERKKLIQTNADLNKLRSKFEVIQTELSKAEILNYDYKAKIECLKKKIFNSKKENEKLNILINKNVELQKLVNDYVDHATELQKINNNLQIELQVKNNDYIVKKKQLKINIKLLEEKEFQTNFLNDQIKKLICKSNRLVKENKKLNEINDLLKNDLKNMQIELDELQDVFRDDEQNEFNELKVQLENSNKNCRLLQFKLTKSERLISQLKIENQQLDNKLKKLNDIHLTTLRSKASTPVESELKCEIGIAKDVVLRLHSSLQTTKGEKMRIEEELNKAKNDIKLLQSKYLKSQILSTDSNIERKNYQDAIRNLEIIKERESDLQEQLKFSENQFNLFKMKMSALENENEILSKQIQTIYDLHSKKTKTENNENEVEIVNELKKDELTILTKRNQQLQHENEQLTRQLTNLNLRRQSLERQEHYTIQGQAQLNKVNRLLHNENATSGSLFYEGKLEVLENEMRQLKNKLAQKEQENEVLHLQITPNNNRRIQPKRSFVRSSSLQD